MIFQVAGPHFGDPAAQIWQKGVPQPVRLEFHDLAFHFLAAGALFGDPAAQIWPKGVPQPVRLEFHDLAFHFLAAEPLFVLPAFWILQKGVQQHLISDFYLFPCAGPLFEPWAAGILQKGAPQPHVKPASTWIFSVFAIHRVCSQCQLSLFLPSLLVSVAFSLWRFLFRHISSKDVCQTCSLCQACLAQSAKQMDLNLNVEGLTPPQSPQPWAAEILQKGGRYISLDLCLFPGAGLLFQSWAAEILQKGASQPDVKLASIWIFLVALPHTDTGCTSVSSLCLCHTQRLYHRQLSRFLPSVSGLLSFGRSLSRNTVRNDVCRALLSHQGGLAQLVEQMALSLKVEGSAQPCVMCLSFLLAFACTVVRVLLLEGKCIASLQEDPAEDSLCLACFYCATTVQGLELDLRFCDGKLDCFFCWTASPHLPLDPFPAMTGRDPPKRGPPPHQFRALPFSRCWTPFPAVSGRDPPKRGVATWRQTSFHLDLFSGFATHRGCASVSSLCSGHLCLWASLSLCGRSFPENII